LDLLIEAIVTAHYTRPAGDVVEFPIAARLR
jgi:hypothetical protein